MVSLVGGQYVFQVTWFCHQGEDTNSQMCLRSSAKRASPVPSPIATLVGQQGQRSELHFYTSWPPMAESPHIMSDKRLSAHTPPLLSTKRWQKIVHHSDPPPFPKSWARPWVGGVGLVGFSRGGRTSPNHDLILFITWCSSYHTWMLGGGGEDATTGCFLLSLPPSTEDMITALWQCLLSVWSVWWSRSLAGSYCGIERASLRTFIQ